MCDLPPEAYDDCFHPPSIPTQVFCLHCQQVYDSYLIEWREEESPRGPRGFWRCPMPGCSGAGFGFDIHPIDPDYIDPDGRDMGEWCVDDDERDWDDDEFEDFDEEDELEASGELDPHESCKLPDELGNDGREPHDFEPALTESDDEHDPFAIPMDDLLPANEEVGTADLTRDEMNEIERKIGWWTNTGGADDKGGNPNS